MRSLVLTVVAITLTAATAAPPASAERYRYKRDEYRNQYRDDNRVNSQRYQRKLYDSAERDRAQNCDPAGQYAGYPAWARNAFSCGRR